jgi:hypothetical protein
MPHIAIINHSTVVTDNDVETMTEALQKQVTKDFAPAWGCNAVRRQGPQGAEGRVVVGRPRHLFAVEA